MKIIVMPNNDPYPWIKLFETAFGLDRFYAAAVAPSGNVYVVGNQNFTGAPGQVATVIKFDSAFNLIWQRTLGQSASFDSLFDLALDGSENVYVFGEGQTRIIAAYDTSGTILWQWDAGPNPGSPMRGFAGAIDGSGNLYEVGTGAPIFGEEGIITKFNSVGAKTWEVLFYSAAAADRLYGIDSDGTDIYVVGGRIGYCTIGKLDNTGALLWQRKLDDTGTEEGQDIHVSATNDVYVTGFTSTQGGAGDNLLLAKYTSTGTIVWQRALGGSGNDYGYAVTTDAAGNVYVVGSTTSEGAGASNLLVAKFDSSGNLKWQRILGGSGADGAQGVVVDIMGRLFITGTTTTQGGGGGGALVVRLPTSGSRLGTYGAFTYQASTLTVTNTTLNEVAGTLSLVAAPVIAHNPGTNIETAGALTETVIA